MKREQAARVIRHLLDADSPIERASRAIAGLGKEERLRLGDLLEDVIVALQFEVLAPIFDQHPDLEPPYEKEEEPFINSELRWGQVSLPPTTSEKEIDAIIFSVMKPQWRKVAMIVVQAGERCKELGLEITYEALAARLQVLAETGRIEDIGDLRKWRFSEVRLKD
jgi:hypothetical protein